MTLATAFDAVCGRGSRPGGVPDASACTILYQELQQLAKGTIRDRQRAGDVACKAFLNLVQGGERTLREPLDDGRVRQYLRRTIRHLEVDMFRRERREVPIDPVVHQPVASELSAEEALESAEMVEELRAAREYFSSVVLPAIAEKIRLPYRAGFQQAILQLTEIAEERSNVDEIVRREFGDVSKATRDRLYQQHSRARRYLMDWIERDLPGLEVSDLRAAALRALVAQFRARPVAARSVTGGK